MVGLPYPNITSPELKEKMDYLNSTLVCCCPPGPPLSDPSLPLCPQPRQQDGRLPGQLHYENLCMKAVNQSIGRAIRHSRDYACIVLADVRYERPNVIKRLPQWIASQLQVCKNFGSAFAAARKVIQQLGLRQFY